ncbi:cell division cycle-associated protein 4 isoform X2 [Talpa occidentalis]|nr:cell division cycle-associated protein 4 isoform X2 [Talpa occidentalis]XP_037357933.1 cell division cycle-associated protein 4 isoform X2 [Talpa occidentalis]XP_037357934.1 cell division cycle-associated protein 4 isoform X2 [Talpa occidentalis]XP_054548808.1 cell division cycle-associated protein 4 isoform X2 [Talpa occidentalis]
MASAGASDAMLARGLKRKYRDREGEAGGALAYGLQRQSLLDMSLVKLQLCHMLAEPSLCRSVLIANTVRQIREEMARDGMGWPGAPPSTGRALPDRLLSTDLLCRPGREGPGHEQDLAPRDLPSSLQEVDSPRESRGSFQKSLDQILETLGSKSPSSVGELFSDVDAAYYGLDAVLTGVAGGTAGLGEGLEAFAAVTPSPPGCGCQPDLGELEHVAGVLVGA